MPEGIKDIIQKCWSVDPEERPTLKEIADMVSMENRVANTIGSVRSFMKRKSFNSFGRSKQLLHEILPPHVARALRGGQKVEPEFFSAVTVFFSDIIGYTELAASLPPQKVMDMLDRLYGDLDELTKKHGLFKVETIGDAYMCVGGLPVAQHDHTARVARFALDAIRAAQLVPIDLDDRERGTISVRAGLHCGPVVASVVGSLNPRYCLFGDTVNTASRMESNSEANRANMSHEAWEALNQQAPDMESDDRGLVTIKGKGSVQCFFLKDSTGLSGNDTDSLCVSLRTDP